MAEERKSLKDLSVIGGALCLDFINTVDWRGREESYDYLADYQGLLDWWVFMGLVDPDEAAGLAARRADEADRTVRGALELREALYRVFLALSRGGRAPGADLERVNLRLPGSLSGAAMESGPEGIRARYQDRDQSLDWPLKPVLRSALEVLTSVPRSGSRPAAMKSAAGSFGTRARTGRGAGATWPTAATGPRPDGFIAKRRPPADSFTYSPPGSRIGRPWQNRAQAGRFYHRQKSAAQED